jgi:hypothetical protein
LKFRVAKYLLIILTDQKYFRDIPKCVRIALLIINPNKVY